MEPFGLLNFLSTLFPQAEQNQAPAPAAEEKTPPVPAKTDPPLPARENPCAEFLAAHDRRVRQTRK